MGASETKKKTMVYHLSVYLTTRKKNNKFLKSQRNSKEKLFVAGSPFPTQPEGRDDFKKTDFSGIIIGLLSQSLLCKSQ